jgi:hypothetical protein
VAGRLPKLGAPYDEQLPPKFADPEKVRLPPINSAQPDEPNTVDPLMFTAALGKYSTPVNGKLNPPEKATELPVLAIRIPGTPPPAGDVPGAVRLPLKYPPTVTDPELMIVTPLPVTVVLPEKLIGPLMI